MKENIIAIPSKGQFRDDGLELLARSGMAVNYQDRKLTYDLSLPRVGDFTVALLRPTDIVRMVGKGQVKLGVVGQEMVEEYNLGLEDLVTTLDPDDEEDDKMPVTQLLELGIGKCRVVLAAGINSGFLSQDEMKAILNEGRLFPVSGLWETLGQFEGKTIATIYTELIDRQFSDMRHVMGARDYINYEATQDLTGSLEAAIDLGLADAIADTVETGKSLGANGLKEIATIFESEGVLVTSNEYSPRGSNRFVDEVTNRISTTLYALNNPSWGGRSRRAREKGVLYRT